MHFNKRFGVLVAVAVYWVFYFLENSLADVGDYRILPYGLHEVDSIISVVVIFITVVLMILSVKEALKDKNKKNVITAIVVVAFCVLQFACAKVYIIDKEYVCTTAKIVDIKDQYHFVINNEVVGDVTISCEPNITSLLLVDGTEYNIDYSVRKSSPSKGKLCTVSPTNSMQTE